MTKKIGNFQEDLPYISNNIILEIEDWNIKVAKLTIKISQVYIIMGEHNNDKTC